LLWSSHILEPEQYSNGPQTEFLREQSAPTDNVTPDDTHRELLSPSIPTKPGKQVPQVAAVFAQGPLFNDLQFGDLLQSTLEI
jgi:hypothetical protein